MSVRSTLTVSIAPEPKTSLADRLDTGRSGNAGEAVRGGPNELGPKPPTRRRPIHEASADR